MSAGVYVTYSDLFDLKPTLDELVVVLGVIWRKNLGDKWRNGLLRAATQFGVAKGIKPYLVLNEWFEGPVFQ